MNQKPTAEEKIRKVLEKIKEQYDLSPKSDYLTHSHMGYSNRHPAGEVRFVTWNLMSSSGVEYVELEKILAKLQEDGLIEKFSIVAEYA